MTTTADKIAAALRAIAPGGKLMANDVAPLNQIAANWDARLAPPVQAQSFPPHPNLSNDVIAAAIASHRKYRIPASVSLAQYAVESAWGTKMSGKNNPFGIKDTDGKNATVLSTREETKTGQSYTIKAGFENFASIADAFEVHGKLLGTAGVYAKARTKLPDPDAFADALTGVYATANNYGTVLKSVMRSQNLYQYDRYAA